MKANLNVEKLINDIVYYIEVCAHEEEISNEKLHIKDGYVFKSLNTGDVFDIFYYLTKDGGKELYNELFIKDDTIMKTFKSFVEKYGYTGQTVKLEEHKDYVMPIFYLSKSKDTYKKEIISEFKKNIPFAEIRKYDIIDEGIKLHEVSIPNMDWGNFALIPYHQREEFYDELFVQDGTILNVLKSLAEDNGYMDAVIKVKNSQWSYRVPLFYVYKIDINKK
jgi:hypothetical protein